MPEQMRDGGFVPHSSTPNSKAVHPSAAKDLRFIRRARQSKVNSRPFAALWMTPGLAFWMTPVPCRK
jgi:hypothetical protein